MTDSRDTSGGYVDAGHARHVPDPGDPAAELVVATCHELDVSRADVARLTQALEDRDGRIAVLITRAREAEADLAAYFQGAAMSAPEPVCPACGSSDKLNDAYLRAAELCQDDWHRTARPVAIPPTSSQVPAPTAETLIVKVLGMADGGESLNLIGRGIRLEVAVDADRDCIYALIVDDKPCETRQLGPAAPVPAPTEAETLHAALFAAWMDGFSYDRLTPGDAWLKAKEFATWKGEELSQAGPRPASGEKGQP